MAKSFLLSNSWFDGELRARFTGRRRKFWSPDNWMSYEGNGANSKGASGESKKLPRNEEGPAYELKRKVPIDKDLSGNMNIRNRTNIGTDGRNGSLPETEIFEGIFSSSSSSGESEDETARTELDQKYDLGFKKLYPTKYHKKKSTKAQKQIAMDNSGKYKCDTCGKGFKERSYLSRHVLIHGQERKFSCNICDKSFKQSNGLSQHVKLHDSKISYDCPVCNFSYKRKKNLNHHLRLHSEVAEFKCDRYPKAYKHKAALEGHRLTHTFDAPFRCEKCDHGFRTKTRLHEHRKVHKGIREFKCEVCSKAFKSSWHLKRHSAIHSNEKPFPCDKCSKTFRHISNRKRHERTHTGERPFSCCDCNKTYITSSSLKRHRQVCPKRDFHVKYHPVEDFPTRNGILIETFASTIHTDHDERGNSGFITLDEEGAKDVLPGSQDLDGTWTGRVIQVRRSSS